MTLLIDQLANEKQLTRQLLSLSQRTQLLAIDIPALSRAIKNGTYHPAPLIRRTTVNKKGKRRNLEISSYKDRIVEKRVLELVTPYAEKVFHPCSFAYRKGIGTHTAIKELIDYRESGYQYAVKSDIEDCFPSIDQQAALQKLFQLLPDHSLDQLLVEMVCRAVLVTTTTGNKKRRRERTVGLPQGLSLSPLLMNLYLTEFDDLLTERGVSVIRYADDMIFPCQTKVAAQQALATAQEIVEGIGMRLSANKTEIMSFEEGFTFLGEEFGLYYPPVEEELIKPGTEKVLYAGRQDARIRMKSGRIIVESRDNVKIVDYPIREIVRIVIFGSVSVSSGVRSHCMVNGIDLVFLSRKGNFIGEQIGVNNGTKVARLKSQLLLADEPSFTLPLVKEIISSKIRHQRTIIQKFKKSYQAKNYLDLTQRMLQGIQKAETIDEIRGYEGVCASQYFLAFGQIVPEEVGFRERTKRPPKDVVNAALGYGYAILLSECISALRAAGLDPAIGFMHTNQDNRPNLALDFIEEFRPYVVDQVVMQLFCKGELTQSNALEVQTQTMPDHATELEIERHTGIYLDAEGKAKLVQAYEKRMLTMTRGALGQFSGSLRRHLYRQAQILASAVYTENHARYEGLIWR